MTPPATKVSPDPLPGNEPAPTTPGAGSPAYHRQWPTAAQTARQHRQNDQLAYGVLDVLQRLNAHFNGDSPLTTEAA